METNKISTKERKRKYTLKDFQKIRFKGSKNLSKNIDEIIWKDNSSTVKPLRILIPSLATLSRSHDKK